MCDLTLSTYEVSGNRESSAQAEDAEDGDKEQHDCIALGGEDHVGCDGVGGGGWVAMVGEEAEVLWVLEKDVECLGFRCCL